MLSTSIPEIEALNAALTTRVTEEALPRLTATETRVAVVEDAVSGVGNLVRAANFIGTADVWVQAPSDVVPVAWMDGRQVLATRSSELNHVDCYSGWGQTNRFAVDVRLTYEVRINADRRACACLSCGMCWFPTSELGNASVFVFAVLRVSAFVMFLTPAAVFHLDSLDGCRHEQPRCTY